MSDIPTTTNNELNSLAKQMRERQLDIDAAAQKAFAAIGEVLELIREQGRDVVNSKTHVARFGSWSEWLGDHVPSLKPNIAAKYERVTIEGLTDIRQCVFAFMPEPDRRPLPERMRPAVWEVAWGYVHKLANKIKDNPISKWPEQQRETLADEIQPVAKELWPDKF